MNSTASCCTINVLPCAVARLGLYKKGSVAPVSIGATSDARNWSAEIGFSRGIFMSGNLYIEVSDSQTISDKRHVLHRCDTQGWSTRPVLHDFVLSSSLCGHEGTSASVVEVVLVARIKNILQRLQAGQ